MRGKYKIENTLGMFDLLKGIAMLLMISAHTISLFSILAINSSVAINEQALIKSIEISPEVSIFEKIWILLFIMGEAFSMPALLIIVGYGFRKRDIKKGLKLNFSELLKPYIITAIVTVLANVCIHYAFFRYLPGAITESAKVLGGMVLGLSQNLEFGDVILFGNGPIWFLLAMFWALTIVNVIFVKVSETKVKYWIFAISILGWLLSFVKYTPFCFSQGLIGTIYIFGGYQLKKSKFFLKNHNGKGMLASAAVIIIVNLILVFLGFSTNMADNLYSLGPVNYILIGLFGVLIIYFFLIMNTFRGKISNFIRMIGRYSLYIICIHTVETIAFPWYIIAGYFDLNPTLGCVIIYFIKLIINLIGCFLVIKGINIFKERLKKWKKQKDLSQKQ